MATQKDVDAELCVFIRQMIKDFGHLEGIASYPWLPLDFSEWRQTLKRLESWKEER